MSKRYAFVIVGIVTAAVVMGAYFLAWKTEKGQSSSTIPISTSQSDWKTYENTAYHYNIKYPKTWYVGQVLEEDRKTVEQSRMVELASSFPSEKRNGYVGITTWDPAEFNGSDQAGIEFRQSISVDLKSFAEAIRQRKISETNDILPNKKVSELREVVFAGQKAFSYIVTGSYDKYGGNSAGYLFLGNKGIKFMVYYSLDVSLPQEIANTFKFTDSIQAAR